MNILCECDNGTTSVWVQNDASVINRNAPINFQEKCYSLIIDEEASTCSTRCESRSRWTVKATEKYHMMLVVQFDIEKFEVNCVFGIWMIILDDKNRNGINIYAAVLEKKSERSSEMMRKGKNRICARCKLRDNSNWVKWVRLSSNFPLVLPSAWTRCFRPPTVCMSERRV